MHDDIPTAALAANQAAMGAVSALRWQKTRWCLVRVPNAELARQAGTDLGTIEDMFFAACLLNYPAASKGWHRQAARLEGSETVRIVAGEETDLEFSVRGRQWMVFDGKINLPDGEIYTAPVNKTLNGKIHFELPGVLGGQLAHDIRLAWKDGDLIHASASSNEDFLLQILATDAGSSRLGEFAFGMNPYVNRFCKDILIDEKIGGDNSSGAGQSLSRMWWCQSVQHPLGSDQGPASDRFGLGRWRARFGGWQDLDLILGRGGAYRMNSTAVRHLRTDTERRS